MTTASTGYDIAFGTYEKARAMVGATTPVRFGTFEVNSPMIRHYCAMVEDANASYWDDEFARRAWGSAVAPPAMLMIWLMPTEWEPGGGVPVPMFMARVPLPGDTFVNASSDTEFLCPVRVGDQLNVTEELVDVSPEKKTALGVGHFVTTVGTYRRQDGTVVARNTNVLFRFSSNPPAEEGAA